MNKYLLLLALLYLASANKCIEAGSSSIGKLAGCKFLSTAPQLQWAANVTLTQDFNWQGADDIKFAYMTIDDKPIAENCYPGQTIKGKYPKGTTLVIEHLCFNFSPILSKGDKLYLLVFSSEGGDGLVIYFTFDGVSWIPKEANPEEKEKARLYAKNNLMVEE